MRPLPVIGLFGTCGRSRWREPFIATYERLGIRTFNPQVAEWTPACAQAENEHFQQDAILLYPVTAESTGFGTLAEVGLAILEIERANHGKASGDTRNLLIFVDPTCTDPAANENQIRDSCRTRTLVASKLPTYLSPNIHLCASLDEMLRRSLRLVDTINVFGRQTSITAIDRT